MFLVLGLQGIFFKNAKRQNHSGTIKALDRIMYGSDWLMMSREQNWPSYPQLVKDILAKALDEQTLNKIYYQNVLHLYGLDGSGKNAKRLSAYYAKHDIKPTWLNKLKSLS